MKEEVYISFRRVFPDIWNITEKSFGNFLITDLTVEKGRGYSIFVTIENNFILCEIIFDAYAKDLQSNVLNNIRTESDRLKYLSSSFKCTQFIIQKTMIDSDFKQEFDIIDEVKIKLHFKKNNDLYNIESFFEILFSLVLIIFPYHTQGETEGLEKLEQSHKYERSKINRSICLAFHGYSCKACGVDLQNKYGEIAKDFIEVHHIEPISTTGISLIDPIKDLVPLCPNCHAIVHKKNPPLSIVQLQKILEQNG